MVRTLTDKTWHFRFIALNPERDLYSANLLQRRRIDGSRSYVALQVD